MCIRDRDNSFKTFNNNIRYIRKNKIHKLCETYITYIILEHGAWALGYDKESAGNFHDTFPAPRWFDFCIRITFLVAKKVMTTNTCSHLSVNFSNSRTAILSILTWTRDKAELIIRYFTLVAPLWKSLSQLPLFNIRYISMPDYQSITETIMKCRYIKYQAPRVPISYSSKGYMWKTVDMRNEFEGD